MEERLDIESPGGIIAVFPVKIGDRARIGIYVNDEGPAVFYANKEEARQIIDMLEKLIEDK